MSIVILVIMTSLGRQHLFEDSVTEFMQVPRDSRDAALSHLRQAWSLRTLG